MYNQSRQLNYRHNSVTTYQPARPLIEIAIHIFMDIIIPNNTILASALISIHLDNVCVRYSFPYDQYPCRNHTLRNPHNYLVQCQPRMEHLGHHEQHSWIRHISWVCPRSSSVCSKKDRPPTAIGKMQFGWLHLSMV